MRARSCTSWPCAARSGSSATWSWSAKLEPFQHGFLGILPSATHGRRDRRRAWPSATSIPESPAAAAKIEPGDVIVSLAGKAGRQPRRAAPRRSRVSEPGQEVRDRGPPRRADAEGEGQAGRRCPKGCRPPSCRRPASRSKPAVPAAKAGSASRSSVPEFKNEAWAYVPEGYTTRPCPAAWSSGCTGTTVPKQEELLARGSRSATATTWCWWCPRRPPTSGWRPDEAAYLEKLVRQVQGELHDRSDPGGGVRPRTGRHLAYMAAFQQPRLLPRRGGDRRRPMLPPPETDPDHRLAIYLATAKKSPLAAAMAHVAIAFRAAKVPVTQKDLGTAPRDLNPAELAELARWIDMLDRI